MSRNGALIEGAGLPPVGSAVRLSRGSLDVSGQVMWLEDSKAGLGFETNIAVVDWLPSANRGSRQQLIDEMIQETRLGACSMTRVPEAAPARAALGDELLRLSHLLERAGEELASDPAIAARHVGPLQAIDEASQALTQLLTQTGRQPATVRSSRAP